MKKAQLENRAFFFHRENDLTLNFAMFDFYFTQFVHSILFKKNQTKNPYYWFEINVIIMERKAYMHLVEYLLTRNAESTSQIQNPAYILRETI